MVSKDASGLKASQTKKKMKKEMEKEDKGKLMKKEKKALSVQGAPGRRMKVEICTVTFFLSRAGSLFRKTQRASQAGLCWQAGRAAVLFVVGAGGCVDSRQQVRGAKMLRWLSCQPSVSQK